MAQDRIYISKKRLFIKEEISKYRIVKDYVKNHAQDYSEVELGYLISNAGMLDYTLNFPYQLRQIYDELGFIDDDKNIYSAFVSLLADNFDINNNIIEVGGGIIPSVAKKISSMQDSGSIIVYDPKLSSSLKSTNKLILRKKKFLPETDVSGADLIIGFMPCDATELIIRKATDNKKDFLIALCEGGHCDFEDFFDTDKWTESILSLARKKIRENGLGELIETNLKTYGDPYPVIYSKRKI